MEELVEVTLDDGTVVRCGSVPPAAWGSVWSLFPECRIPPAPVEEIDGFGGVTRALARPGSEMYEEWEEKATAAREARTQVEQGALFFLGVEDWKLPGQKRFSDKVPKDWQIPKRLQRAGITPRVDEVGRKYDFIVYGLAGSQPRHSVLMKAISPESAEDLTNEEVEATAEGFPSDEVEQANTSDTTG